MGEIVDLAQAQGMVAGQIYGYVPDPPWGPPHECPGCQPRPDKPDLAILWDRWQVLEAKLRKLGESPSCPIVRGEKLPEPYTNAERVARGGIQTDRLPRYVPTVEAPIAVEPSAPEPPVNVAPSVEPTLIAAAKEGPAKATRRPTKRAPKTTMAPEEQGKLF